MTWLAVSTLGSAIGGAGRQHKLSVHEHFIDLKLLH